MVEPEKALKNDLNIFFDSSSRDLMSSRIVGFIFIILEDVNKSVND